ncbi:putative gnat family protein [Phaeoacremonium minimum UCRPA7]|uniref:Putative gnat family protein n=1 Tax=Phaeoacremonium minimum (strain UCR-PA7) TaxID=1286976 RepID=R8BNY5_PHAM7|nr:putative gnat family protein [Phaeoacremonium minimum UCRPA7]EOO01061.1 putative gnat family protein [Phaeoacremonium minimum UCRPA7]
MMLNVPAYASAANHNRRCELGISLAPEFQNKGYGTEAITWAVDWAFRFANMHCVYLNTISFNVRGQKVYEKIGFRLEGRLRHYKWHDRQWHDQLLYSILEDEWEDIQKAKADAKAVKEEI